MNKHVQEEKARRRMIEKLIDHDMGGLTFEELWERDYNARMVRYKHYTDEELADRYAELIDEDEDAMEDR